MFTDVFLTGAPSSAEVSISINTPILETVKD